MKKSCFNDVIMGLIICMSFKNFAADMNIQKAVDTQRIETILDDKTLEMAIQDIWDGYFFLLRSTDHAVIEHYGTREAVIEALLKQAVSQSRFMLELYDKRPIIEQVLLSFALYGDRSNQHDFAVLKAADDLTKNKRYFELFSTYLLQIGQMIKEFSESCTRNALSALKKNMKRLTSQINIPAVMKPDWDHFQKNLRTIISQDFSADMYQTKDFTSHVCMRAGAIADSFMTFTERFASDYIEAEIMNARSMGEFLFSNLSHVDLNWCACPAAPFVKRIALAVHMIDDIVKRHSDKNKQLVYTSLATGQLLMDFLVISGLQHQGFKNIDINLIDLDIKGYDAITTMLNELEVKRGRLSEQRLDVTVQKRIAEQVEDEEYDVHAVLQSAVAHSVFEKAVGANYSWAKDTVPQKLAQANRGVHVTRWGDAKD